MKHLLLLSVLYLYAISHGASNAVLWSKKGADSFAWNEHLIFVVERACLILCIVLGAWIGFTWELLAFTACGILAFPFWHNGAYYTTRDLIDGSYPRRFISYSTSSTAEINFTWKVRLGLFLVSILILVLV